MAPKKIVSKIVIVFVLFFYGCAGLHASQHKIVNEIVLAPGDSIIVEADWAVIKIISRGKNIRDYTWEGETISVELIPRQNRWHGSLGLYHPQVRPPHEDVVHMVVEEGQQHFLTMTDALDWIASFGEKPIYRDDGLLVSTRSTGKTSGKKFVNISVWQIYIKGKKPTELSGSRNNKISRKHITT